MGFNQHHYSVHDLAFIFLTGLCVSYLFHSHAGCQSEDFERSQCWLDELFHSNGHRLQQVICSAVMTYINIEILYPKNAAYNLCWSTSTSFFELPWWRMILPKDIYPSTSKGRWIGGGYAQGLFHWCHATILDISIAKKYYLVHTSYPLSLWGWTGRASISTACQGHEWMLSMHWRKPRFVSPDCTKSVIIMTDNFKMEQEYDPIYFKFKKNIYIT